MLKKYLLLAAVSPCLSYGGESCINTFRVPINSVPPKIDPHLGNEFDLNAVALQMFEGLTSFSSGTAPRPNLANWEINYKESKIIFKLSKVEFSDGSQVTSMDVANSILRSEKMGNAFSDVLKNFKHCNRVETCPTIKILDDKKISFLVKNNAFELFLKKTAGMEGAIVKEKNGELLGTAPFLMKNKEEHSILLSRWQKTTNNNLFDCIRLVRMSSEAASAAFRSGEIDIINNGQFKIEGELPGIEMPVTYIGTGYIGLNFRRPNIKNLNYRRALSLAIDRNSLAKTYGIKPAGSFVTLGLLGYEPLDLEYNPIEARRIIKRENLVGQRFVLLISDKHRLNAEMKTNLTRAFDVIGLKLVIEFLPFTQMLREFREDRADGILKTDSPQNYDPTTMFIGLATGSNSNSSGYSDERLDSLINRAKTTLGEPDRVKLLHQINAYIVQKVPVLTIGYSPLKRWVRGGILIPNLMAQRLLVWTTDYTDFEFVQKPETTEE
jgi:ABC-type transport system substrate-binding protein